MKDFWEIDPQLHIMSDDEEELVIQFYPPSENYVRLDNNQAMQLLKCLQQYEERINK